MPDFECKDCTPYSMVGCECAVCGGEVTARWGHEWAAVVWMAHGDADRRGRR